jgi:hypothetical protein
MAMIGLDCEVVLDGTGYYVKPGSYQMLQPRIRQSTLRADGNAAYVDLGPGKRVWKMTLLCMNELLRYDGQPTSLTGQQYRDALRTSYLNSVASTLTFSDPLNGTIQVHFDTYSERILDLHKQVIALATGNGLAATYEVTIELVEA